MNSSGIKEFALGVVVVLAFIWFWEKRKKGMGSGAGAGSGSGSGAGCSGGCGGGCGGGCSEIPSNGTPTALRGTVNPSGPALGSNMVIFKAYPGNMEVPQLNTGRITYPTAGQFTESAGAGVEWTGNQTAFQKIA